VVALALLLGETALFAFLTVSETSASDAVLVAQARVVSASLEDVNGRPTLDQADIPGETSAGIAVDAAVVANGALLVHTSSQPLAAEGLVSIARAADQLHRPAWRDMVDTRGVHRRVYATPIDVTATPGAVLVVSRSVEDVRGNLRRMELIGAVGAVLMLVLIGISTYWMVGRALAPVRKIAVLARSISERDLHRRVELKVPEDELGDLVGTFNSMLARLEGSFEALRRFTADASHELRAPLTVMRTEIEGALSRKRSAQEYRSVIESVQGDVEHLSLVTEQLLLLARADAGSLQPGREPVDLADLLEEAAARWRAVAERTGVQLRVEVPAPATVSADPRLLRRVLDNLVDNAIRHSPRHGDVVLRASPSGDGWDLEVADAGPGVPPELRARLFERFAKSDRARSRESGGAGLGLALSAAIARAHGGWLALRSDDGTGAVFRLHVPDAAV
jgi:heavy metal sensor kinase